MLIDWFTVCAQTLNFLILVWLMQRFLYKPILRAIDAREKRIADALAEADLKKAEAQKERDTFQKKNEDFERQRAELMSQMNDEVESERFRLLDEVRQAADTLQEKRLEIMRSDARTLSQSLTRRAQQEVFAITRKTLADLATTSLEEQVAGVFVGRLNTLTEKEKADLRAAFKDAAEPLLVRSAFELPAAQRDAIEAALNCLMGKATPVRFETAPDLVGGIDLSANGRKVSWNIAAYLQSFEKGLGELLELQEQHDEQGETAPEVNGSMTTIA